MYNLFGVFFCLFCLGSGTLTSTDSIKTALKGSFVHKFFEASVDVTEEATVTDKFNLKSNSKIEATSPLGLNVVLEHIGTTGISTEEISADSTFSGMAVAGPLYGKTVSTQSFIISPFTPAVKIDSSVQLDSTFAQGKNTITATLTNGEFSIVSNTNVFEDTLTNVADFSIKDSGLSLKCDSNAFALGMKIRNLVDASAGAGEVIIRIETTSDQSENPVYSLLTAILDVNGLVVTSDATVKLIENEATHKAAMKFNQDGFTTSGTTILQSPLLLENTFNAGLDTSGATLSITNKAEMGDIKFGNANNLLVTLSSFDFNSKVEALGGAFGSYTQDVVVNMKPYTATANVINNLNTLIGSIVNEAKLDVEPYKMDLTGSLKAVSGREEIKHTYQVNYADMAANAKCSTTGKLFGTQMSHNVGVEIIGLAARITNDARFNSQPVRFDHTIRCSIVPFDFNLDAIFNGDGDMTLYGKHSAQLYGKWLLRAQPLAFASSHECRGSLTHQLDNGFSTETTFDTKLDNVLSLQEQRSSLRMRSKVNEHALNQDFSIYNTAEGAGVEVSGTILTSIFNMDTRENKEFTVSGFVKYDKNTDSRTIQFPFMENLPVLLESMKDVVVRVAEVLQDFINNKEVRAALEAFPQRLADFMSQLNVEDYLTRVQVYFSDINNFAQNFVISAGDVEASLRKLQGGAENLLRDVSVLVQKSYLAMKDIVLAGTMPTTLIQNIHQRLNTIDEAFNIKATIVYVIDTIMDKIQNFDLEKLQGSSIAFLNDFDAAYDIKMNLRAFLRDLKRMIETFDFQRFFTDLKQFISSIRFKYEIDGIVHQLPLKFFKRTINTIIETMQEYNIIDRINLVFSQMGELIVKFEADKKVQAIMENVVELMRQFKVEETIRTVVTMVSDADIPTKLVQVFQSAINYLKTAEIKGLIQDLNIYIEDIVNRLKAMDYNSFVDYANQNIARYTSYLNDLIRTLEIPQKLEATRNFVNFVLSSVRNFAESMREIKVREMFRYLKDIVDQIVLPNLHAFAEFIKQEITDLDIRPVIRSFLQAVTDIYRFFVFFVTETLHSIVTFIDLVMPRQKITTEMKQIINGVRSGFRTTELKIPSFTIPLTDLVVPSWRTSMYELANIDISAQLDIPEFTILGVHTVKATTVSAGDVKERIIRLIDFIVNFEIEMIDPEAFFGELTMNFLPPMPEITIPDITFPEISVPTIPQVPIEKLVNALQFPEFKLPTIPTEIMVPCFGKLYGEVKFITPIYNVKTSAEVQNSTESEMTPTFTALLTSQATSPAFEILNYKLVSTARIAFPKMSRVVFAETVQLNHQALVVDHQASLTLYGLSAQAQGKTGIKVMTSPYTANFMNMAFIAIEEGMSASLDTSYTHVVNLPIIEVKTEATVTQKAVLRQDGFTITFTADNSGGGKFNAHNGNHKSNLHLSLTPGVATLTFTGDTDSTALKMKQQMTAELGIPVYLKFNIRNAAEAPVIKSSLFVASGHANLYDMKAELKANHDTELVGPFSGTLSNGLIFVVHPSEMVFDFQNKANTKVILMETLLAKIDLQNDYSAILRPDSQQMNTVALARLNQYKMFYNFTVDNNPNEAGIFAAMESEADLDFLNSPISIPELDLPFVDFRSPAISNLNLFEQTGLRDILTTTEQTVNVDAKVVYQKSQVASIIDIMGMIQIPAGGNMISELAFKSAIINLNVNAGLFAEDDLVLRLRAVTASEFESLRAKLDGTTSLTTRRGIKLANSMSLENLHIEGTHDSTITMISETFETAVSVTTAAKVALPILTLEANQNLVADTKTKANAVSTFNFKGNFNIPVIKAVGKANGDHSLKMERTVDDVSVESAMRATLDGTVFEDYLVLGFLDNELNFYLNNNGLRSTSKVIADGKFNNGATKVLSMDVNENMAVELSLSRVYALLKYAGNNEANLFNFNTAGKHVAQATVDLALMSPMTVDVEIDISQPTNLGDFSVYVKNAAGVTAAEQKMSTVLKFVSPLYITNVAADIEGKAPVFKAAVKSSANSAITFLDYDMDGKLINTIINRPALMSP